MKINKATTLENEVLHNSEATKKSKLAPKSTMDEKIVVRQLSNTCIKYINPDQYSREKEKDFTFTCTLDAESTQSDMYDEVSDYVIDAVNGYAVSLVSYGGMFSGTIS